MKEGFQTLQLAYFCDIASDEDLMMSRKACHANGVSSIVTRKINGGGLHRAFLAWPGHQLNQNTLAGTLPVGVHDHRYPISLQLITGKVRNTTYVKGYSGALLNEFRFESGGMSKQPKVKLLGTARVRSVSETWLSEDDWLDLEATTLHNIDCSGAAAWWVLEGETEQTQTTLLSPQCEINITDLYEPFESPEEVKAHVAEFLKISNYE